MHSVLTIADRVAFLHETRLRWIGAVDAIHEREDPVLDAFVQANQYQIGNPSAAIAPGSPSSS